MRAAMSQLNSELNITQKGILRIIGHGSEQTIAKYLKEIKDELGDREITPFSPEIPKDLISSFEKIYHKALEYSENQFSEGRLLSKKIEEDSLRRVADLEVEISELKERANDAEMDFVKEAHRVEIAGQRIEGLAIEKERLEANIKDMQMQIEAQARAFSSEKSDLVNNHKSYMLDKQQEFSIQYGELREKIALISAEKEAESKQIAYERERSDAETARLMREIDNLKIQNQKDQDRADNVQKRISAELTISHAREDKLAVKVGGLEELVDRLRLELGERPVAADLEDTPPK